MEHFEEQEYNKGFDANVWKKLFQFVMRYKKTFVMLLLSGSLLAVAGAVYPFMVRYAIDNFATLQYIEATSEYVRNLEGLPTFIALLGGLMAFQALCVFVFIYTAGRIDNYVAADVREAAFHHLQNLSFTYFDNTPTGWIMARLTSDTHSIGNILSWGALDIVHSIFMMLFYIVFMFIIDWRLALVMLAIMPFLVVISIYFQRKLLKAHRESRKKNSKITASYNEGITGAKTTKTLLREHRNYDDFKGLSGAMRKASVRAATISGLYFPIVL
ncbi:MAG: ABC transporter transmembrane domain-containing protein, partial [Defluviitaleaceae bacterium]|nr:ABC transporter transmembrane domain-containing protein [Defluviitaleaceae bacterium]